MECSVLNGIYSVRIIQYKLLVCYLSNKVGSYAMNLFIYECGEIILSKVIDLPVRPVKLRPLGSFQFSLKINLCYSYRDKKEVHKLENSGIFTLTFWLRCLDHHI